jgi:S-adenosylmethionine:tRNA ribosyltransferase-isomerase
LKESFSALVSFIKENNQTKLIAKTQIIIAPPYKLKVADILITNFHQPKSTLLLLVAAVIGEDWKKVYEYALQNNFRFLSYGDSCLLFAS